MRGSDGDHERSRVGVADVFGREHDHPPGDVTGVLSAFEHRREVVHRGVGIRAAHRLDERRDEVVVRVTALVVDERTLTRRIFDV